MPRDNIVRTYDDVYGYAITLTAGPFEESDVQISFNGSASGRDSGVLDLDPSEVEDFVDTILEVYRQRAPEVYPDLEIPSVGVTEAGIGRIVQSFISVERPMVVDYTKENGEDIRRVVSPLEIKAINDGTRLSAPRYVKVFDHQKRDFRNLRLTRLNGIAPASEDYISAK